MKKIFLATAILFSCICHAQFYAGLGVGYTTQKAAAAELFAGYDFKVAFVQAGYLASVSNATGKGCAFNVRAGHSFVLNEKVSMEPSIGYVSILRSNDHKEFNTSGVMGSLYLTHAVGEMGQLFFGANYIPGMSCLSIGIRFKLDKNF